MKERLESLSRGVVSVRRVIGLFGWGVERIWAVTTMQKGSGDVRDRDGGEVLRVMPMVTEGLSELQDY